MHKFYKTVFALGIAFGAANAKGLQGFYVGADLGTSYSSAELDLNDGPSTNIHSTTKNNIAQPNLGLSFGYDHVFTNSMLLGLEFFGDYSFGGSKEIAKMNVDILAAKIKGSRKGLGLGILAKIGAKIGQTTIMYIGGGFKSIKHTLTYEDEVAPLKFNFGKRMVRPLVQVGLQGLFGNSDQFGWRATYSYVPGKNLTVKDFPRFGQAYLGSTDRSINVKANEHSAKLGVFYRI
ncbi:hypothetical protein [Candidatus Odyssella thessalonicensis]|uniref:hypothetical protein n=1 Tax=Candidatus Odyssella thessalonicensis TaxID=84647 RepID=UPI000225BD96|nr:hypothetical protein [Candidatus Odyssella thessalonicensis]